jgi:diguanylate cyclase (GGDEF)-like protein
VSHALERAQRSAETLAVLFLDLDSFKTINDSLGHAAGDRLLVTVASRLQQCVRGSDTVARLGGDEFALLIENASGEMSATKAAERITLAMRQPITIEGKEMFITASIGIAAGGGTVAGDENTAAALLRNADMAMYTAKGHGKGLYESFERHMHWEALDRLDLEADLRHAVERGELTLMYQPIVSLATGKIVGAEALLRWVHPRRGVLYPARFISVAEEMGVIVEIGDWVVQEACRQAAPWAARLDPAGSFAVAVNVSGHQLQHPGFVDTVRAAVAAAGLPATTLVLEITESALMHGTQATLERLTALKSVGVRLAIDDFGTGYSSLSYLQRFPIDILKVAKPFVDDLTTGTDGGAPPALARAIIALSETLGLQTIAEGIEVASQAHALLALGCELGQGYFYSTPLLVEQMQNLIACHAGESLPLVRTERTPRRSREGLVATLAPVASDS